MLFLSAVVFLVALSVSQGNYCQAPYPTADTYVPLNGTLLQVHIIHRHGDRSPVNPLPIDNSVWYCSLQEQREIFEGVKPSVLVASDYDDPWRNTELWRGNCSAGQLTEKGGRQLFQLGKSLAAIWAKLPNKFDHGLDSVYLRASEVPRAQQSLQSLVAGIFETGPRVSSRAKRSGECPPSSDKLLGVRQRAASPQALATINVDHGVVGVILPKPDRCPRLKQIYDDLPRSPEWLAHKAKYAPLIAKLNAVTGTETFANWGRCDNYGSCLVPFFDNFNALRCHNQPLPCSRHNASLCVTEDDFRQVSVGGGWEFRHRYGSFRRPERARIEMSPLMKLITNELSVSLACGQSSVFVWSGHDDTVGAVLGALQHTNFEWPPYASNILIESWSSRESPKDEEVFTVRVLYNGAPLRLNEQYCGLQLGARLGTCRREGFVKLMTATVLPTDLAAQCQSKSVLEL